MVEEVGEIISKSFEEVSASSLILKLLDCYSKLYLNGSAPGLCNLCHREYYTQITKNGMELAKKYEEAKARTCKPNWNGLKYINATARHWNSDLLTDKEAIYLLEKGILKTTDFDTLPSEYGKPIPEEKIQSDFQKRQFKKKKK
jgi:hypothetical protein